MIREKEESSTSQPVSYAKDLLFYFRNISWQLSVYSQFYRWLLPLLCNNSVNWNESLAEGTFQNNCHTHKRIKLKARMESNWSLEENLHMTRTMRNYVAGRYLGKKTSSVMSHRHILWHVCPPNGSDWRIILKLRMRRSHRIFCEIFRKRNEIIFQWLWRRVWQLFGKRTGIAVVEE